MKKPNYKHDEMCDVKAAAEHYETNEARLMKAAVLLNPDLSCWQMKAAIRRNKDELREMAKLCLEAAGIYRECATELYDKLKEGEDNE